MPLEEIRKVVSEWLPVCDACGERYGRGEFTANGTPLNDCWAAARLARDAGWKITGRVWLCAACVKKLG